MSPLLMMLMAANSVAEPAAPAEPGTPAVGAVTIQPTNTTASDDSFDLAFTTATGDFVAGWMARNQNADAGAFGGVEAIPAEGAPVPLTLIASRITGTSGNVCGVMVYGRGLPPDTYTLRFSFGAATYRDPILWAADVTGMRQSGSPIGGTPQTNHATDTAAAIQVGYTPANAVSRLIAWAGINVGNSAMDGTGIGGTRIAQASTGGGTDTCAAVVSAVAETTDARNMGHTFGTTGSNRFVLAVELLPDD